MRSYTFTERCVFNDKYYDHFGIHPSTANLYGNKESDIVTVTITVSDDQTLPSESSKLTEADYWGWYDGAKNSFTMIYPQRFLLNMCFPGGINADEEANAGKAFRLIIK